jgi:hypothetical protein
VAVPLLIPLGAVRWTIYFKGNNTYTNPLTIAPGPKHREEQRPFRIMRNIGIVGASWRIWQAELLALRRGQSLIFSTSRASWTARLGGYINVIFRQCVAHLTRNRQHYLGPEKQQDTMHIIQGNSQPRSDGPRHVSVFQHMASLAL